MSRTRAGNWVALALWIAGFGALQAWLGRQDGVASRLVPDWGLLLVVVCAARAPRDRLILLTAVATLARAGLATEPPVAVLFGIAALVTVVDLVRNRVDVEGFGTRALLCALCVLGFHAWSLFAWSVRIDPAARDELMRAAPLLLPALASGVFAFFFLPAMGELPGLGGLTRRRW